MAQSMGQTAQPTSQAGSRRMIGARSMFRICSQFSYMSRIFPIGALTALALGGCQKQDADQYNAVDARISVLEVQQQSDEKRLDLMSKAQAAPIEQAEMVGYPGPRRFYTDMGRCLRAVGTIHANEVEEDRKNREPSDPSEGPPREIIVSSAQHLLSCIPA